jgi:DNA-directed RNA polymerase subunit RPC12/RpoP
VYRCCDFPDDDEYPKELCGLTPVPKLLQGFAPRHYFEKHLNFRKCNEVKMLEKDEKKLAKMCTEQKTEMGKRIYVCSECTYSKVTKAAVEGHFREKHTHEKPFQCEKCKYSTYNKDRFSQHTKRNGCSQNSYSCSKCNFVTSTKANLFHHEKKHEERKYQCSNCQKKFTYSWVLKNHKEKACKY